MGRIVCWFSCGAASAVATKLAIKAAGDREVVVARCVVREEHPDNDRFSDQCAEWFGLPVTKLINEKYDGSVYEVIRKRAYISGPAGAPCTLHLKKDVRVAFERPTDTHVFGYTADADDVRRYDRFLDANNIDVMVPLIDRGLIHADCLGVLKDEGIEIPAMYRQGFKHNNCIGCVKSTGQGYWNKVRDHYPIEFKRMADLSRSMGVRMIESKGTRIFLDELVPGTGRYEDEKEIQCGAFCSAALESIHN